MAARRQHLWQSMLVGTIGRCRVRPPMGVARPGVGVARPRVGVARPRVHMVERSPGLAQHRRRPRGGLADWHPALHVGEVEGGRTVAWAIGGAYRGEQSWERGTRDGLAPTEQ